MELRSVVGYSSEKPREEDLWKNKTLGYRLQKAGTLGAITGVVAAATTSYFWDYPVLGSNQGYKAASWSIAKMTGRVALAFGVASMAYQGTVEFVNRFQERRTAFGPFFGGIVGGIGLGVMTKYFKTSVAFGVLAGTTTAIVGHLNWAPMATNIREKAYDDAQVLEKFRYLKALEGREKREAERLAELAALREYHD